MDARRRTRFESLQRDSRLGKGGRERIRREGVVRTRLTLDGADVCMSGEIRAGGDNDGIGKKIAAGARGNTAHCPSAVRDFFGKDGGDLRLHETEIRLIFQHPLHVRGVEDAIRLHAFGADGGALARVQHTGLDRCDIGGKAHLSAERIDFVNKVTLSRTADGGIARQIRHGIKAHSEEQGGNTHAGAGERGFDSGVPRADDDDGWHKGESFQ